MVGIGRTGWQLRSDFPANMRHSSNRFCCQFGNFGNLPPSARNLQEWTRFPPNLRSITEKTGRGTFLNGVLGRQVGGIVRPVLGSLACLILMGSAAFAETWSGPYGGVQLGYSELDASGASTEDGEGVVGGIHVGYDVDLGSYIVGGELDYDSAGIDLGSGPDSIDAVTRLKVRAGSGAGSTLIYGTAGLALIDSSLGDDSGYFVGAGVGQEFGDNVVLGGEVLFHNFEDVDGSGVDLEATTLSLRASFRF